MRTPDGRQETIEYDRLVIATGAVPARPPIPGIELPGVHMLHTMGDASAVQEALNAGARSAVIIGAGYIGVEMADALTKRGLDVSLIEQAPSALTTVDPELGTLVVEELSAHGVRCSIGARVTGIAPTGERLRVTADGGVHAEGEIVLVLAGVQPDTRLAREAGATVGVRGAIAVDRQMRTGLPDIWAAGDCIETYEQLFDKPSYMPLGSTAHKQGRIAGENAIGGSAEFAGSLGTQVVKVFDLAIAATGLRESVARAEGLDPLTVETTTDDHKAYYPGAHPLRLRIVGDRDNGHLLGAQILARLSPGFQARRHGRHRDPSPHDRRRGLRPRPQLHTAVLLPVGSGPDRLPSLGTRPAVPKQCARASAGHMSSRPVRSHSRDPGVRSNRRSASPLNA